MTPQDAGAIDIGAGMAGLAAQHPVEFGQRLVIAPQLAQRQAAIVAAFDIVRLSASRASKLASASHSGAGCAGSSRDC